jgi:ribosomal-protein-alanine N-acetyltransferase
MLTTQRLDLVPNDSQLISAALDDATRFGALLDARIPPSWPPDLLDRSALEWTQRWLTEPANDPRWGLYWVVLREPRTLIGTAGYKGGPMNGVVELGYGIVAEHQRRGYATEATRALVDHAFSKGEVTAVIAETLPDLVQSIGVLEKCRFRFIGDGSEPGVIRYELTLRDYAAASDP